LKNYFETPRRQPFMVGKQVFTPMLRQGFPQWHSVPSKNAIFPNEGDLGNHDSGNSEETGHLFHNHGA
jgi:hypothetical protein